MLKCKPSKAKARYLGCGIGDSVGGTLPSPPTFNKCPCVVTGMGYFLADIRKNKVTTKTLGLVQEGFLFSIVSGKLASGSLQLKKKEKINFKSFKNESCKHCTARNNSVAI